MYASTTCGFFETSAYGPSASTVPRCSTVMQRGSVLAEGPYAEVSRNPQVVEAYMGSSTEDAHG